MRLAHGLVVCAACSFSNSAAPVGDDNPEIDAPMIDAAEVGNEVAMSTCMPSYTLQHGTSWYRVAKGTWYVAVDACEADGGHLVVIGDAAENTFVHSLDTPGIEDDVWIGMSDHTTEDTFRWITGAVVPQSGNSPYQAWNPPQPNNAGGSEDCGEMNSDGTWNDLDCSYAQTYVCECDGIAPATPKTWCRTGTSQNCESCGDVCITGCDSLLQVCL